MSKKEGKVVATGLLTITITTAVFWLLPLVDSVALDRGRGAYSGRVLLVSMDGFRWDYLKTISGLGNFSGLAATGCSVDYVDVPFATMSLPSHYTIATGLHEESHGVVANHFYDPQRNATFFKDSKESFWWDGGEPIWVTAERQNKRTGVHSWPGCEAEIRGYRPSSHVAFNNSLPLTDHLDTAISWLKDQGMDLVLLYVTEPDHTGHKYGPQSPELAEKVREMDDFVGLILKSMEENHLDDVNIIFTSDHGMTDVDMSDRLMNLWDFLDPSLVEQVPNSGMVTAILPAAGREQEVVEACRKIPHVTVYRKEEIPDHLHYKHNPRIMPVIVLSDEGWVLASDVRVFLKANKKGDHAFSSDLPTMKAIFMARGPDIRKGSHATSIRSVDIYPLVCRLLNIDAAPNNGSLRLTQQFLVDRIVP